MQNLLHSLKFLLPLLMALLIYESSTWAYNWTIPDNSVWLGVNPPKSEQTDFIFRNNLIQSNNTGGYMLQAGIDPLPAAGYNNTLDGQIISGNKFDWVDPSPGNSWWSITHGLFTGHERNAYIKHNYLNQVPMAIIRKSCNLITDTSGGIYYNIINGGGVGVNIKGLSGVRVYNNTIYGNRSVASGETWRPLIYIYTNTDTCASGTGGSPAAGTKIKNNILYTAYDQKMITLSDASCVPGFESDYNIFWKEEDGSVRFGYLGSTLTFEAWQALGYDTHSVVMDPNFIDVSTFVPTARLDYGTNLGTDYSTGLATTADWVVGTSPDLTLQNGTWQVGAVLYEAETPIESSAYYVSAAGNDASNGLTPETAWRTIDKVNASMGSIEPGESILFRRGDTFYGTINITKSGTSGNPITFGAYGTGAKPIITGFTTITSGWTNEGNGIYSRDISADQQTNMVLIDGSQYGMGRWPKGNTYNYYETLDGSLSITDNQLSGEPDWTGADVVIRHTYWLLNRYTITNHDGSTIYYNNTANIGYGYANMGYFIQNDLSTLYIDPTYGEWYHDTAQQKLYVYFGSDPGSTEVKVATKKNFVTNNEYDYLTFNGLSFIGCASTGINLASYYCTNITITDCSIQYAGLHGISEPAANSIITNNTINRCNESGITATGDNCDINYNHITNIGLIPGQAYHGGYSTGIRIGSTNAEVLYNTIENIGYCGISGGSGSSATVRYNYVNNYCLTVNDGGGLYHGHNTNPPPGQWIIEYNIFLNGYGETNGTSSPNTYLAEGIYLDSYCADASVKWNICANNRGVGIKLSSGHGNTIENNLCYNNDESQMYLAGMWSYATLYDNTIRYNQLIGKDADHLTLKVTLNASDNISNYGLSNYNFFARPVSEGATIYTSQTGVGSNYRTLSEWQSYSGQDANSLTSFTSVSSTNELEFYYNETSSNKIVASLTVPMVDVSGNTYPVGNLTLAPWTGVVLMPNNDVSVYYLAADGSDNSGDGTIENPWFSLNKVWPLLEPGDTVYMRDGSYGYTYRQYLTGKNGTANARINIWAYPGENPQIIEPEDVSFARNTGYVIYFKGDYFHWKGIEISNYKQLNYDEMTFPFRSEDSDHNIFELLTVHDCGFGIHIGGSSDDNLFLNCDIYNIYDPLSTSMVDGSLVADPYEDGDGFSIGYGGLGTTNTYRGCRAWNIADDGWDLWRSDSHVIIDRCWTWNCGFAPDGSIGGNGNGFKLGITETSTAWAGNPPILRTITNSITYGNRASGVHQNGSYCATQFYNNIAYDNGDYGFWMASYNVPHVFKNNISYANGYAAITTAESIVEYNTFLVGNNQTNPSFNVTDNDFISINASSLSAPRQANGDLPVIQFLHLAPGSDLIHAGTDISTLTYDGDGNLWNDPPSLGAFEYSAESSTSLPYLSTTTITDISTYSATGGGNVIHDGSTSVFVKGICWNTSLNPTISNTSTNNGTGEGSYISYLTGLNPSTHYFVRAYAINAVGIAYGDNVEFDTLEAAQEQPSDVSVGLKTFLVNPYVQSRYYVSYAGKFYVLPYTEDSSVTPEPEPEPSTYLYKRTGDGWDESGVWAYDEYCATFDTGCVYDVSFGIVTDNTIGHFTILSEIPNWLRLYDTFTEEDLSVGSHISDVSGRVFKAHPMTENTTGQDRDGSVYITNDFGQSVTFYVIQYRQPVAPTLTLAIDPCDYSNLDLSTYDSATVSAGSANAVVSGLYLVPWPYDYIGDMDVSWRAVRTDIEPNEDYGAGSLPRYDIDDSINETLVMSQSANSSQEFYVYFKQTPELSRTPSSKNFTKFGGDVSINITTNPSNPWIAYDSCTWITLTNESSTGNGQFIITVAQQPSEGPERNGLVYINSAAGEVSIYITQDESIYYPITKETGGTYSESGSWNYNEYCVTYPCAYDLSIGINSDLPAGKFNILTSIPDWMLLWDTVTEQDISTEEGYNHVSTANILKMHPITENTSYTPRDGSIYITNETGGNVTFYVYQGATPTPPGFYVEIDPSDESGLVDKGSELWGEAGNNVLTFVHLYVDVSSAGTWIDVNWRAQRTSPTNASLGSGTITDYANNTDVSEYITLTQNVQSGDTIYVYLSSPV